MPKYITHWILAEKAYTDLNADSDLKKMIGAHKNIYMAGAVILDTPFYLIFGRGSKVMNQVAEGMHDTGSDSYRIIADVLKSYGSNPPEDVMTLLIGIITHIQADATFHPLVYHFSGMGGSDKKERERHHRLECYMDLYFRHEFRLPVKELFSGVMQNLEMKKTEFLHVLSDLFSLDQPVGINFLEKAVRMNALLQSLFDKNLPRMTLKMLNYIPGVNLIDFISHFYPHPKPEPGTLFCNELAYRDPVTGEARCASMISLAEQCNQRILEIFYLFQKHWKKKALPEAFSGLTGPNLYTGRHGTQKKDMKFFDTEKDIMELVFGFHDKQGGIHDDK